MTRDELLKYVGKIVKISPKHKSDGCYLSIHKYEDYIDLTSLVKASPNMYVFSENEVLESMYYNKMPISSIKTIDEIFGEQVAPTGCEVVPIYEYFGHEIGDWISKPIEE